MYVSKEMRFEAAHRLPDYDGACRNLHGHSYRVEVEVDSEIDSETGMVMDFKGLSDAMRDFVDRLWDHTVILQASDPMARQLHGQTKMYLMKGPPTAENMCHEMWDAMESRGLEVFQVCIWETETSRASLTAEDRPEPIAPLTLLEGLYGIKPSACGTFAL